MPEYQACGARVSCGNRPTQKVSEMDAAEDTDAPTPDRHPHQARYRHHRSQDRRGIHHLPEFVVGHRAWRGTVAVIKQTARNEARLSVAPSRTIKMHNKLALFGYSEIAPSGARVKCEQIRI